MLLKHILLGLSLIPLAGCDRITPLPEEIKPAVDRYHLAALSRSDLLKPDISRALSQLSRETCNRDAMGVLAAQIENVGYRRESANAMIRFNDTCGHAEGFMSAAVDDLMAVSDFEQAASVSTRLIADNPTNSQYYFDRGRAYEAWEHGDAALADYMQALALSPDLASVTSNLFVRAATLHARAGRFCDSISMIRMWMSADPTRADNVQAKGMIAQYASKKSCPSTYATGRETFARRPGNTIQVKARINGVEGNFIVDTGATFVFLGQAFSRRAHVELGQAKTIRLQTANGSRDGLLAHATSVGVGNVEASNVPVSVDTADKSPLPSGVDGLLGQSFLSRFDTTFSPGKWSISQRS